MMRTCARDNSEPRYFAALSAFPEVSNCHFATSGQGRATRMSSVLLQTPPRSGTEQPLLQHRQRACDPSGEHRREVSAPKPKAYAPEYAFLPRARACFLFVPIVLQLCSPLHASESTLQHMHPSAFLLSSLPVRRHLVRPNASSEQLVWRRRCLTLTTLIREAPAHSARTTCQAEVGHSLVTREMNRLLAIIRGSGTSKQFPSGRLGIAPLTCAPLIALRVHCLTVTMQGASCAVHAACTQHHDRLHEDAACMVIVAKGWSLHNVDEERRR